MHPDARQASRSTSTSPRACCSAWPRTWSSPNAVRGCSQLMRPDTDSRRRGREQRAQSPSRLRRRLRHVQLLVHHRPHRQAVQPDVGPSASPCRTALTAQAETFEYCRLDKHFRYISEQVSCVRVCLTQLTSQPPPADQRVHRRVAHLALLWGGRRQEQLQGPQLRDQACVERTPIGELTRRSDRNRPRRALPAQGSRYRLPDRDRPDDRQGEWAGGRALRPFATPSGRD